MNANITNTTFTFSCNSLNSSAKFVVNVVFSLQYCVSRLLLIFFLSLLGGGWGHTSCFYVDVLPMILNAPNLWWYWIVTISQVWWSWLVACSCHPWGKLIPQKEMGWAVPATMLLHGRKLSVYMRLEAGGDFSTTCAQETACQMSDFPSGGLPGASQKGTGVVVKYYSLTFYLLRDQTGAK